jgi:outer membrane protein assembly factor BamA
LQADSLGQAGRVDFRNYRFSSAFEEAAPAPNPLAEYLPVRREERTRLDANGNYVPRKYKLDFSPDIVYGAAGYDALYGVQGVTQMMFSDMLGDHRIVVATNLLIDLRNSDYIISYNYLPKRVDWTFSGFHISRLLADFEANVPTYYRYRQYGSNIEASYPIDKFRRLDFSVGLVGVSQADVTDVTKPSLTRVLMTPGITFTRDGTTPGYMYPTAGSRLAFSVSGSALSFTKHQIRFLTFLGDARRYFSFGNGMYVFALRASAGTSIGPNKQLFYTSGVQNWINRGFDQLNGFPISDVADFVFATPILPLRGYSINSSNGSNFGLVNAEFRFPLVAALLPGPIPIFPFYRLEGQVFMDAGAVWGGRGSDRRFNLTFADDSGRRRLDDLLIGTGFGFRTIFLGYPIRFDFAWPFDGRRFGDRRTYISIGLDF